MCSQASSSSELLPLARFSGTWWALALILVGGVLFIGLGARVEVPMVPVPMSLQTYAVVVVGALAGWRLGAALVSLYLVAGAAGAPLFAGGSTGVEHLVGSTAGYLVGFVVAAALVGWLAEKGWTDRGLLRSSLAMLLGHVVTLSLGTVWLATRIGASPAIEHGLLPFLIGAAAKSILAALTVEGVRRMFFRVRYGT